MNYIKGILIWAVDVSGSAIKDSSVSRSLICFMIALASVLSPTSIASSIFLSKSAFNLVICCCCKNATLVNLRASASRSDSVGLRFEDCTREEKEMFNEFYKPSGETLKEFLKDVSLARKGN